MTTGIMGVVRKANIVSKNAIPNEEILMIYTNCIMNLA